MDHPLDGVHKKLERAHENIVNLEREIETFLKDGPYETIPKNDPKAFQEAIKFHTEREVPVRFSILSGEIIHQLRSCLDHIAWQLSSLERRAQAPTAIEFPIFLHTPRDKAERSGYERKVKGISEPGRTIIEKLQPYHRTPTLLTGPESHPLRIIHEMDVIDKHREFVMTISAFHVNAGWEAGFHLMLQRYNNLPEVEIARLGRSFNPNCKITAHIAFRDFGGRKIQPVVPGLYYLARSVHSITGIFAQECFRGTS